MRFRRTVLCAVVVLAAPAAWATTTKEQAYTCPLDGTKFTGRVVVSTNNFGGVDSDMCPWAKGDSPLPENTPVTMVKLKPLGPGHVREWSP